MAKSTKEEWFEAWDAWDREVNDPQRKRQLKQHLDKLTDQIKKETGSKASRSLTLFYHRKEYAAWKVKVAKAKSQLSEEIEE